MVNHQPSELTFSSLPALSGGVGGEDVRDEVRKMMAQTLPETGKTNAQILAESLVKRAQGGDQYAAQTVLQYLYGKAPAAPKVSANKKKIVDELAQARELLASGAVTIAEEHQ